jgi:hypothetical protein
MSEESFQAYYDGLTDDQLIQIFADRQDLVPEAAAVLDHEVRKRRLKLPEPPHWTRGPESTEPVCSLDDYEDYRQLAERKRLIGRYGFLFACAPIILGLALARHALENSIVFISLCFAWMAVVIGYCIIISIRFLDFKCPQCSDKFGSEDECITCAFPRSLPAGQL